jgi:hypothetical protein
MKSIGCDVAAVASVAGDQKPMATGTNYFQRTSCNLSRPCPSYRRSRAEAYGSPDSEVALAKAFLKEVAAAGGLAVDFKLDALKILRRSEDKKPSTPVANQSDS